MDDYDLIKQLAKGGQGTTHVVCEPQSLLSVPTRSPDGRRAFVRILRPEQDRYSAPRTPARPISRRQAKKKSTSQRLVVKQTQCENVRTGNDALREAKTLQVADIFCLPAESGMPACLPASKACVCFRTRMVLHIDWYVLAPGTASTCTLLAGPKTPLSGRVSRRLSPFGRRLPRRLHSDGTLQ